MLTKEAHDNQLATSIPSKCDSNGLSRIFAGPSAYVLAYPILFTLIVAHVVFFVLPDGMLLLARALRKNGVGVSVRHDIGFEGIAKAMEAGYPIIAGIDLKNRNAGHWVVVYGYCPRPRLIHVCNQVNIVALSGRETIPWARWKQVWDGSALICWGKDKAHR